MAKPMIPSETGNRLLDCLPSVERGRARACCKIVTLRNRQQLSRADAPLAHVYFPISCVCSIVVSMANGRLVEAGMVGNEGMVGVPAFLTLGSSLGTVVVQVPGTALRVDVNAFRALVARCAALDKVVRRYIAYTVQCAMQTIACNAVHSVEERACRWLLTTCDRLGHDDLHVTHESLAEMLGSYRQTVSVVAAALQRAGLIQYRRGRVRIMDRASLEGASCECHAITNKLYADTVGCP